tara:strand:- start:1638 stop:2351 length:714 start_codon:yes stop_codon:yes gene_type:complete
MNLQIIIHALIAIFVLHVILINLEFKIDIGNSEKNIEKMTSKVDSNDDSLNFLLDNDNSDNNDNIFNKKMNQYIDSLNYDGPNPKSEFQKLNELPVEASNSELNNDNTPNFESNVVDTAKFYKINNNYDNMTENELKATSIEDLNKNEEIFSEKTNTVSLVSEENNIVRKSEPRPNNWDYKDDFPMNGGKMGSIVGFDGLESQFANFSDYFKLKETDDQKFNNVPHDDLRKPVVYNN